MADAVEVESNPAVEEEAGIGSLDAPTAMRKVLRTAMENDFLVKGLHEVAKAIDAGKAKMCFLSQSCDEKEYTRLITALCNEKEVPLLKVEGSKMLGEWCGLCKVDMDGNPRKVIGASCACITDFKVDSSYADFLKEEATKQRAAE
eukprot:Filipodium_phascolosomae@DN6204_c0_g1_i1.p1